MSRKPARYELIEVAILGGSTEIPADEARLARQYVARVAPGDYEVLVDMLGIGEAVAA